MLYNYTYYHVLYYEVQDYNWLLRLTAGSLHAHGPFVQLTLLSLLQTSTTLMGSGIEVILYIIIEQEKAKLYDRKTKLM